MSLNILELEKESCNTNYEVRLTERKNEVEKIVQKYSRNLFGHNSASIKEIRMEAIKKNLELVYNQD